MTKPHKDQVQPDRQKRPTILLFLQGMRLEVEARLVALSEEYGWDLLDNGPRGEHWPPGLDPQGAVVHVPHGEDLEKLMQRGCPTVRIGKAPHPNDAQVPAAMPDLPAAGRLAAEHFEERRFRHVGFVCYDKLNETPIQGSLYEGFRTRATELGCECHLFCFPSPRSPRAPESVAERYWRRQRLIAEWLRTIPKPVALFTFSDGMARELCCMCEDAGLAVPDEVAILGLGNSALTCACSKPPLSSIALNHVAQADAAARLLQQLIKGEPIAQPTVQIPPLGVVERGSTNTVGTLDPHVGAAVRYMWAHLNVNLTVDDVAREVGVPRRTLDRHFRGELGRSVNEELRRKRLQELCRLLRTTDDAIVDLAPRVGFSSPEHLHRIFRREHGISPRQYRLREQAAGRGEL